MWMGGLSYGLNLEKKNPDLAIFCWFLIFLYQVLFKVLKNIITHLTSVEQSKIEFFFKILGLFRFLFSTKIREKLFFCNPG
jgi:hypothetical protein